MIFVLLLLVMITLWWLSTERALTATGLMSSKFCDKADAIAAVAKYAKKIEEFPGKPVISVQSYDDGSEEVRLVARTMGNKNVVGEVFTPFVFPGVIGLLFGAWCVSATLHLLPRIKKSLRTVTFNCVVLANILAVIYYVGIERLL